MAKRTTASASSEPKPRVVVDFSKIEIDTSLVRPSLDRLSTMSSTDDDDISSSTMRCTKHDQHLKVQVKQASINFNKLACPSRKNSRYSLRRQRDSRLLRRYRAATAASAAATVDLSTYENAIDLDLVISFAGRTYSTKRTFQQLAHLRQELVQELATQQEWSERRLRKMLQDDASVDSWDISSSFSTACSSDIGPSIPALPRMSDAGAGFAQVSGMMRAYRPALEEWFQSLVNVVSEESPILADFLWEPLSAKCKVKDPVHASLTELGAIQEGDM